MHHVIPLHALVLTDAADCPNGFPDHEFLSLGAVAEHTVGARRRHDLLPILYNELKHQVSLKLSLGERAVVSTRDLASEQRRHLVSLAEQQGARVFTLGHTAEPNTALIRPSDTRQPVHPLPRDVERHLITKRYRGVTVIGDVHGELDALKQAFEWARSRQHFVWLLGDIIDYGKQTLAVADYVHAAVMDGDASLVLANHERKIARWLDRPEGVRLSEGNRVTTHALNALSDKERRRWCGRFRALLSHSVLLQQLGNVTLLHGAAHPSLWTPHPDHRLIEQFALYGEADHSTGKFRRAYRWVEAIPADHVVIAGHDILSPFPMAMTNSAGGKAVFLDTGCGKRGRLSSADLRFPDTADGSGGLFLECFKRY